jgi:phage protein D
LEACVPTGYTPIFQIYKGGVDITDRFNDRTTSIKVILTASGAAGDYCEVVVDDRDWKIASPELGGTLEIWLGYLEVGLAYMGTFELIDVTFRGPPKEIMLHGNSNGMKSNMKSPVVQEFDKKTVGEILSTLAGAGGVGFAGESGATGLQIPFKNQLVSPYHLVHELERLTGGSFKMINGKLQAIQRDAGLSVDGKTLPVVVFNRTHFGQWSVRHALRTGAYKGAMASWWDPFEQVRKWSQYAPGSTGGAASGGDMFQLGKMFKSEAEAQAAAKSSMAGLNREATQATFVPAKGDPWIRDGQQILVTGMRDGIDGSYTVNVATHTYVKSNGLMSELECTAPGTAADYDKLKATIPFLELPDSETVGEFLKLNGGTLDNIESGSSGAG